MFCAAVLNRCIAMVRRIVVVILLSRQPNRHEHRCISADLQGHKSGLTNKKIIYTVYDTMIKLFTSMS